MCGESYLFMGVIALKETPVFVEIYREISRAVHVCVCVYVSKIRESGSCRTRIEIPGALDDVRVRGTNLLEVS